VKKKQIKMLPVVCMGMKLELSLKLEIAGSSRTLAAQPASHAQSPQNTGNTAHFNAQSPQKRIITWP
jgi:hypothetical protein